MIKYEYRSFIKNKSLEEPHYIISVYDDEKAFKFKDLKTVISTNGLSTDEIRKLAIEEVTDFNSIISYDSITKKSIQDYDTQNFVTALKCNRNFLLDLNDIEKLTELKYLDCSTNYIENIKPILKLKKLTYLDISQNVITSIKGLNKLPDLKYLDCSVNLITTLRKSLPHKLRTLKVNYNHISSLDGIEDCQNLRELYFFSNQVSSLLTLKNHKELTKLNCSSNFIKSLDGLNEITTIEYLDCGFNTITTLNPIQNSHNLREIFCDNNFLKTTPTFLANFTDLISINIDNNPIRNTDEIERLLYRINNRQSTDVKVYNDNQNVHNSFIVNAIKSSIKNIMKEPLIKNQISNLI